LGRIVEVEDLEQGKSSVISVTAVMSEAVQLQMMDLMYDSVRTIAYPGQAKGAEPTYRLTRGMNEAFLEIGAVVSGPCRTAARCIAT
jgi:hypothetical protein